MTPTPADSLSLLLAFIEQFAPTTGEAQTRPLWHYTDSAGFQGILGNRVMRATNFAHLNDSSELVYGEAVVLDAARELLEGTTDALQREILATFIDTHDRARLSDIRDFFVASFCDDSDAKADDHEEVPGGNRLSQWRGYGTPGAGYSIAFSKLPVATNDPDGEKTLAIALLRMSYSRVDIATRTRDRFVQILQGARALLADLPKHDLVDYGARSLRINAASFAAQLKHNGFHEEQEWRLIAVALKAHRNDGSAVILHRPSSKGLVPYVEIPLAENLPRVPLASVRVGPGPNLTVRATAAISFLETVGYEAPNALVSVSDIPFVP